MNEYYRIKYSNNSKLIIELLSKYESIGITYSISFYHNLTPRKHNWEDLLVRVSEDN